MDFAQKESGREPDDETTIKNDDTGELDETGNKEMEQLNEILRQLIGGSELKSGEAIPDRSVSDLNFANLEDRVISGNTKMNMRMVEIINRFKITDMNKISIAIVGDRAHISYTYLDDKKTELFTGKPIYLYRSGRLDDFITFPEPDPDDAIVDCSDRDARCLQWKLPESVAAKIPVNEVIDIRQNGLMNIDRPGSQHIILYYLYDVLSLDYVHFIAESDHVNSVIGITDLTYADHQ